MNMDKIKIHKQARGRVVSIKELDDGSHDKKKALYTKSREIVLGLEKVYADLDDLEKQLDQVAMGSVKC